MIIVYFTGYHTSNNTSSHMLNVYYTGIKISRTEDEFSNYLLRYDQLTRSRSTVITVDGPKKRILLAILRRSFFEWTLEAVRPYWLQPKTTNSQHQLKKQLPHLLLDVFPQSQCGLRVMLGRTVLSSHTSPHLAGVEN